MQSELGWWGDWIPAWKITYLVFDSNSDIWKGAFEVTPANDQDKKGPHYKVALNGSWNLNYGLHASQGVADVPLVVDVPVQVGFFYDN